MRHDLRWDGCSPNYSGGETPMNTAKSKEKRPKPLTFVRSAHSYISARWSVEEFRFWRTFPVEGECLAKGVTLAQIREVRERCLQESPPSPIKAAFQSTKAFDAYDEFLGKLRRSKKKLLPELPVQVVSKKEGNLFKVSVHMPNAKKPRYVLYGARKKQLQVRVLGMFGSEFADDIAKILGDTAETRFFAAMVLSASQGYAASSKPAQSPSSIRKEIGRIEKHSRMLGAALEASSHGRYLLKKCFTGPFQENICIDGREVAVFKGVEENGWTWGSLVKLLGEVRSAASELQPLLVGRGAFENSNHNYTPLVVISDAWESAFGELPSASDRSRFMSVIGYCLLLFTHRTTDIAKGLKFSKKTREARKRLGGAWKDMSLPVFSKAWT